MSKKLRPLGKITEDLEKILFEMHYGHDLQHGEVRAIVERWQDIHAPDKKELYIDGTNPISFYGHRSLLESLLKTIRKGE